MTDLEKVKDFLDILDIGYSESEDAASKSINIEDHDKNVEANVGFIVTFNFKEDGKFDRFIIGEW